LLSVIADLSSSVIVTPASSAIEMIFALVSPVEPSAGWLAYIACMNA